MNKATYDGMIGEAHAALDDSESVDDILLANACACIAIAEELRELNQHLKRTGVDVNIMSGGGNI